MKEKSNSKATILRYLRMLLDRLSEGSSQGYTWNKKVIIHFKRPVDNS
jgi:hypothetical protein